MDRLRTTVAVTLALITLGASSPARSHTIVEEDGVEVKLGAAGQGSARLTVPEERDARGEFTLDFARIWASTTYEDVGSFKIQLGAAGGTTVLKDALVSLDVVDRLSIQAGRFKAPVSAEEMISTTDLVFTRRAATTGLVLARAPGGQMVYTPLKSDSLQLDLHAGVFSTADLGETASGAAAVGRVRFRFASNASVHVGFAENVSANGGGEGADFPNDRQLDVAAGYDDGTWRALVEGVYVFDGPDGREPSGLYGQVARIFDVGDYGLQPGVAYDYLRPGGGSSFHRATAVLNVRWLDTRLMTSVEYGVELREEATGHFGTLSFQGAF